MHGEYKTQLKNEKMNEQQMASTESELKQLDEVRGAIGRRGGGGGIDAAAD